MVIKHIMHVKVRLWGKCKYVFISFLFYCGEVHEMLHCYCSWNIMKTFMEFRMTWLWACLLVLGTCKVLLTIVCVHVWHIHNGFTMWVACHQFGQFVTFFCAFWRGQAQLFQKHKKIVFCYCRGAKLLLAQRVSTFNKTQTFFRFCGGAKLLSTLKEVWLLHKSTKENWSKRARKKAKNKNLIQKNKQK